MPITKTSPENTITIENDASTAIAEDGAVDDEEEFFDTLSPLDAVDDLDLSSGHYNYIKIKTSSAQNNCLPTAVGISLLAQVTHGSKEEQQHWLSSEALQLLTAKLSALLQQQGTDATQESGVQGANQDQKTAEVFQTLKDLPENERQEKLGAAMREVFADIIRDQGADLDSFESELNTEAEKYFNSDDNKTPPSLSNNSNFKNWATLEKKLADLKNKSTNQDGKKKALIDWWRGLGGHSRSSDSGKSLYAKFIENGVNKTPTIDHNLQTIISLTC